MAAATRNGVRGGLPHLVDTRRLLLLSDTWRILCTVLAVVPLPGLGTFLAGWKNPHSGLRSRGILQMILVVFGSWPLILPGVAGFIWACWGAVRIHRDARPTGTLSQPTDAAS
ncbi:MAG: hypothetical protein ACPGQL_07835 [Thermoplasmatota archaeon]